MLKWIFSPLARRDSKIETLINDPPAVGTRPHVIFDFSRALEQKNQEIRDEEENLGRQKKDISIRVMALRQACILYFLDHLDRGVRTTYEVDTVMLISDFGHLLQIRVMPSDKYIVAQRSPANGGQSLEVATDIVAANGDQVLKIIVEWSDRL